MRIRAAALLAAVPTASQPPADRERFERAAAEFIAAQKLNADRPEARSALGSFYARRGLGEAEAEYKAALRLTRNLRRRRSTSPISIAVCSGKGTAKMCCVTRIAASPRDAGLHHALGLTLTRLKRPDEALDELRRAAELAPEQARYAYVYAVGLHSAGRGGEAMTVLKENLARHPGDRATLSALVSFSRDAGDLGTALDYAGQLARFMPNDPNLRTLDRDSAGASQKVECAMTPSLKTSHKRKTTPGHAVRPS